MRELHSKAAMLFTYCTALILIYAAATLVYAAYGESTAEAQRLLPEMLHSIGISALLALGGTILLDLELTRR